MDYDLARIRCQSEIATNFFNGDSRSGSADAYRNTSRDGYVVINFGFIGAWPLLGKHVSANVNSSAIRRAAGIYFNFIRVRGPGKDDLVSGAGMNSH